jgi:hypothetical protein
MASQELHIRKITRRGLSVTIDLGTGKFSEPLIGTVAGTKGSTSQRCGAGQLFRTSRWIRGKASDL